jgi:hypothetical protein
MGLTTIDARWCTNEACSEKTSCGRWIGFYEGDSLDPRLMQKHGGGPGCEYKLSLDEKLPEKESE